MATPSRPGSFGSQSGQGTNRVVQNSGGFGIVMATGPSPRKKLKVEDIPGATEEIGHTRQLVEDEKLHLLLELKESYYDHLTECFFLQNGGGLMDYYGWRKRPTPQLVHFLKSGHLDSDDEDENPIIYLKESKAIDEVKIAGASGSLSGTILSMEAAAGSRTVACSTVLGQHGMHRSISDSRLQTLGSPSHKPSLLGSVKKNGTGSPGNYKQVSYDGTMIKGISTQEAIVERAKQEAQVMSRVAELRKDGLWSSRRLPKVQEPPRPKAHWDYLLEEMQWLAADFQQERKWKKSCARKIAKMVQKYFLDLEQKELRAEKEEGMKLKRIASNMSKMVKEFWTNIEKVVQYKQNSRLDEKRKKAMDLHLNFIVNQTEQYSNWLSEGLAQSSKGSSVGSVTPDHSVVADDEFNPEGQSETDDEETIEKDEQGIDEMETQDEVAALQKESELPIEQLIENLPKEILEKPASIHSGSEEEVEDLPKKKDGDDEFEANDDESDVEETIEEQEKVEVNDYNDELDDLKNEGELDIEALRAKYAAAYDSDFEIPDDSGEESTDIATDDDEEEVVEEEVVEEETEEDEEEDETMETEDGNQDVGLEALVDSAKDKEVEAGPVGQELTDIAAQAASLQPKGYTLQTAEVKTGVPFLVKHTLREYQHVGLDWLATMYEKRLNGILADEMGLGKTIQTIALIAHLACEKGIWGPHLIVVPTSVMLNWEMEFKKWAPAFKILTYYGSQKERKQKRQGWTKTNAFHICITSYKLVIQDHNAFRRKKWKYLILDEAQNIKNFKSQRWQCLLNFNSMRRLLLTGTPLQNSLMELWSLMHFLMPHVFQSHKDFKEWFANPLTGMIEGSHEYNENLVRRLHKVLRPFLLRRLKDDVEKQMPKKYEHIVMCHLSKRQRFLYDEFMAQGKTKETLATGHFMSVINILMQLRKVCNHPSLFDPRPIISPLQTEGIVYHTASLALKVMQYDPLNDIDLQRYPGLAEMERDLPAFIAHRVRKLQTSRRLIEEIEISPSPPPRPLPGKLKTNTIRCVSPAIHSGRASPAVHSASASPAPVIKPVSAPSSLSGSSQPSLQATVAHPFPAHSVAVASTGTLQPASSQPITVQIQHTEQGTRLVVPSNQLSQLPGFLQIVQTASGPQAVATASVVSTSSIVHGSPVVTMASSSLRTIVSSSMSQVKMPAGIQSGTCSPMVQFPAGGVSRAQRPMMRVSPLIDGHQSRSTSGLVFTAASTAASTSSVMSTISKPVSAVCSIQMAKHLEDRKKKLCKTQYFMEPLYDKQSSKQKERLSYIARTNKQHCERKPVYGQDLCDAVNMFRDPYSSRTYRTRDLSRWHGPGHIHCQCVKVCDHPKYLWNQTSVLSDILHTPEQYLHELEDILDRFVFVTPPVQSQRLRMHVSHPPPSYLRAETYRDAMLRTQLSPKTSHYHKICTKMTVQFPELRLIQYDCGKLQTLDILLHRLKTEDHRVLLFTQMTRMLDILEAFLNYHGHRYLRLDGTTKIEQRQLLMDRFNADRRIFVFILSTRSGGIGVNLTGADTVIFYDSDWNPTMDAQAQDRCHRIGQTRDVHIYRLVSERTVEENILKKANQKRMLGDMAIEGGNFTTAFFKENTISELFSEPSGLDSLVKEKELEEKQKQLKAEKSKKPEPKKQDPTETQALMQFEKALAKTEDETDAVAIEQVKAEQKAELAEFDESIPLDEGAEGLREDESHVEQELAMLDKELTPIERYAVHITEQMMEPVNEEELKIAEEDIEAVKKDWELNRLKALKEEEERRAEMEEDEMLYTYSRDDAYQQVFLSDLDQEQMPLWSPPTPPHDDNDVYIDQTLLFLYEHSVMPETQLPPVYVKKEKKKIKVESITTRKQKQKREEQPRVPRSLFDRANAQLLRLRRDAKLQKLKMGQLKPYRPLPSMPPKPVMEQAPDHPEWLIHEDWALLQAVQSYFDVPLNLMIVNPAHTPNWDMVADVVNSCSRVYRSPKQCRLRYENVIIPREEGRIIYDITPRKQKKQKGIYKMSKGNRAMKTGQIHSQDTNNGLTILYSLRFDSTKCIAAKRPPTMRQTLVNPTLKNPKHASVLQENNIQYDQPLNPMQVAEIRAQRIQREKKQNQQQQAAATATGEQTAPATNVTQRVAQQGIITGVQVTTPTIVAMTTAVTANQLAAIGTSASAATVLTVTGTPLGQATIRQRAPLTVQEIGAGTSVVGQVTGAVSQVRTQLQTATTTVTTALTPVQLAQRISAVTTLSSGATVQQQLQAAGKTALTQQQFQLLQQQQQTLINRQKQQQQQQQAVLQQQQQQLRTMQKLTLPDPLRQQQLRQIKGPVIQGQKTVIAQQLVTSMTQGGQLKGPAGTTHLTRPLTQDELARLKQQQQQLNQQKVAAAGVAGTTVAQLHHSQIQSTQIIAGTPMQQVSQALSKVTGQQAAGATLVKTVTAPAGSVTIPVTNVSINVSMPQKGGVAKVSQINPQQMHLLQQRKQTIPVQKGLGQKAPQMLNAVQIIQQQGRGLTVQQLHQLVKQQSQGGTIQQIIHTSQPTIIATVTQSQATPQMVTKVIATTATVQAPQLQQTIQGAAHIGGSSAAVTTVPVPASLISSLPQGQSSMTASIIKPGSVSGVEAVTAVQIHPISSINQSKLAGVAQNVVVAPVQSVQHVTVAAQGAQQQAHIPLVSQVVVSAAPVHTQTLQVTVPASNPVQAPLQHVNVQQVQSAHVTVSSQRGASSSPAPLTVTVTPNQPQPAVSATQGTTIAYTSTPPIQTHPAPPQTQPTDQASQQQQTVATILQTQRQAAAAQHTVQVQHTPSPQPSSQTIHIQSTGPIGQPATQGQPQTPTQSPQAQGKAGSYGLRTRTQSKPQ